MSEAFPETRTLDQLPRVTSISPDALVGVQEEGGPVAAMAIKDLLGRLIQTDTVKETRVDLLGDLDHDDSKVGLVFADPDPAKNGWYRKVGDSGEGTWEQFEKLSDQAAAEIAGYVSQASDSADAAVAARDAALALSHFRSLIADGVADFAVGDFFSSAESGELRLYERIAAPPYYGDLGDEAAPVTKGRLGDPSVGPFIMAYEAPGAGSTPENVAEMLDKSVWLDSKGADRSGVNNAIVPFLRALETGKPVIIPEGIYNFGDLSSGAFATIDLRPYGEGLNLLTMGDVEIRCNTIVNSVTGLFGLGDANKGFRCGKLRINDTGGDPTIKYRGAYGFNIIGGTAESGDMEFEGVHGKNLAGCVMVSGKHPTNRLRDIRIRKLFSESCYYGVGLEDQGDHVRIDQLLAYRNKRCLFVYGVTGVRAKILNRVPLQTTGMVNISRSPGGYDTSDIHVDYACREAALDITHVLINHIDLLGGTIKDVHVNLDIESPGSIYDPVRFVNYTGSGGSETAAASTNQVYDIHVRGTCDANARPIAAVASYSAKRKIKIEQGRFLSIDATVLTAFYLNATVRGGAVIWAASVTPPAIGNGTLNYAADLIDGIAHTTVRVDFGSTTTFGSGIYTFTVPHIATRDQVGSIHVLDSGTGYKAGVAMIDAGTGNIKCYFDGGAAPMGATTPIIFANGDKLRISIAIPVT